MVEEQTEEDPHYVESNIKHGYAYSIFDCFSNNRFNMVYVQKIPDWEIKLRKEYLEAMKETTNRKTRDEIIEIKRKRKDLRTRIKEEDKKRIDFINKEPVNYRIFKIMSNAVDQRQLTIMCPFNEEEIYTAKKCLANKISRPPNYYDFYDEKKEDKSAISTAGAPVAGNQSNQQAIVPYLYVQIENSIASALKPLTNFSKLQNHREPEDRGKLGTWILDSDLASCFEYVQIYYNPTVYPFVKSDYYQSEQEKINNFKPDSEVIVIEEIKYDENAEDSMAHGNHAGGQHSPALSSNQGQLGTIPTSGTGQMGATISPNQVRYLHRRECSYLKVISQASPNPKSSSCSTLTLLASMF